MQPKTLRKDQDQADVEEELSVPTDQYRTQLQESYIMKP